MVSLQSPTNELPILGDHLSICHKALASLLRAEIEAIGNGRSLQSDTAITPKGTAHVVIMNGRYKAEKAEIAPQGTPIEMAYASLQEARHQREAIDGDAYVVWRHLPMFEEDGSLRMRLCFEAV